MMALWKRRVTQRDIDDWNAIGFAETDENWKHRALRAEAHLNAIQGRINQLSSAPMVYVDDKGVIHDF